MSAVRLSVSERLHHAVGDEDLSAAASHLLTQKWRADRALQERVSGALVEWEGQFTPPGRPDGVRLRPLVTGQHNVHHVYSPRPYSSYDDEWDEAVAPTRCLHWYFNNPGRGDTGGHQVSLTEFLNQVKHYLLYSDAIAFELPVEAERLGDPWQLGRLLRLCQELEPLLRNDIVVLVPNKDSRPAGLAQLEKAGRKEFAAIYPEAEADDPLGPLAFPYDALPAEWFSHDLRAQRFSATIGPLVSGLAQADHYDQAFDLYANAADVALLRAMLHRSALSGETVAAARKAQQLLILHDIARLRLPMGKLEAADIVSIRAHGQFEIFRETLRHSISQVSQRDYADFFDPRAQAMLEIRDELRLAERQAHRETSQSKWMRCKMLDTTELTIVSGLGAAGSVLGDPLAAAGLAAGGFFASKMVQWLKGRSARDDKVFARHIAVFDE
ncbi:hypothetical protein [Allorhizocola rhizosphaerae]|uniref:hypothetical protein n=1 Tax=Allorhizocola rhizosphaerae TaxID=1872709 RepID=UPI0013C2A139|nr:hypothetical protein [Allorhizocola rhizosphaerae]